MLPCRRSLRYGQTNLQDCVLVFEDALELLEPDAQLRRSVMACVTDNRVVPFATRERWSQRCFLSLTRTILC